jgi:hypothetical protein
VSSLFEKFDFNLLGDPEFREDSVREELVAPLLAELGYTASQPYRIIRSRKLEHPYVYFGTASKHITIIPDYVLERDGTCAWILDAKAPNENIDTGKNVEQAYSYAMHRDVRVQYYALCNGRKLVVYDVKKGPPILDIPLKDINQHWTEVLTLLGTKAAWPNGLRPDFLPDLGLALLKAGLAFDNKGKKVAMMFMDLTVMNMARPEDDFYTMNALQLESGVMASFDISKELYQELLEKLPETYKDRLKKDLTRHPYQVMFSPQECPPLVIAAEIADSIITNDNESYLPFKVFKFI